MAFVLSYVLCALTMAAMMACRFSLAEPMWERLQFSIFWGLFFSLLLLVIFAAPLFTVLFFIGERWPSSRRLLAWVGLAPALVAGISHLYHAATWCSLSFEREHYEKAVGVPLAEDVRVVYAKHGAGLQDRRHVWLFEGTPDAFAKMVADRGWGLQQGWTLEELSTLRYSQMAKQRFSEDAPWEPAECYFWWSEPEEDEPRVVGGGHLIPDRDRRRWYVEWSG